MKLPGHGRYDYVPIIKRPVYDWPEGKRLAVFFCNNIEHFAFGAGLGEDISTLGAPQTQRNFGWRDYGLRVGIWRIFDMMDELKLPMCHLLNASVCEEMPQIAARIRQRGDGCIRRFAH